MEVWREEEWEVRGGGEGIGSRDGESERAIERESKGEGRRLREREGKWRF